jgi:hypothetical protein
MDILIGVSSKTYVTIVKVNRQVGFLLTLLSHEGGTVRIQTSVSEDDDWGRHFMRRCKGDTLNSPT